MLSERQKVAPSGWHERSRQPARLGMTSSPSSINRLIFFPRFFLLPFLFFFFFSFLFLRNYSRLKQAGKCFFMTSAWKESPRCFLRRQLRERQNFCGDSAAGEEFNLVIQNLPRWRSGRRPGSLAGPLIRGDRVCRAGGAGVGWGA